MALITTLSGIPWYVHVGIGRTLLMFSRNKAGKKMPKNMEEFFFFSTFKSILWKFLRPEFGHNFKENIFKPFPGIRKKERGKFGVWNQPSFLFTNQLHSFSCFKRFSPAQHKLDVSNAHRLGCIIRYWGGFYHWQSFLQSLFSFWNLLRWKVDVCSHSYGGVNICDMRLCVLRPGVCLRIANTVVPKSRPTKRAFILHIGPQSVRRNFAQRANLEFRDGSPMFFCSLAFEEEKTRMQCDKRQLRICQLKTRSSWAQIGRCTCPPKY